MFVCPIHETKLLEKQDRIYCPVCPFAGIKETSGMWNFLTSKTDTNETDVYYDPEGFMTLYGHEENHFWFASRIKIIKQLFDQYIPKTKHLLEIGAGTCQVANALKQAGYQVSISDVHQAPLQSATRYEFEYRYRFDLLNNPLRESFDAVGMFDVLEHIEQEEKALKNVYDLLKPGGILILTVPAHEWLWNHGDKLARHKRRYTLNTLRDQVTKTGLKILNANYFFRSLVPLLALRALISRVLKPRYATNKTPIGLFVHPWINKTLMSMLSLETRFFFSIPIPFGGSIWLVAQKPNQTL